MGKLKTGIIDDHPLFAEAIAGFLHNYDWADVVFTGHDGASLFAYIAHHPLDLLLLDISLPDTNGMLMIPRIRETLPGLKILILSTHQPADIGLQQADCLFDAYVLKISGRKVLEDAFEHLRNGQRFFDPALKFPEPVNLSNTYRLTKREKEIIALITTGKTTREIAAQLYLSEQTIKTHRRNISEKLGGTGISDLFFKMNQLEGKK